MDLWILPKLIYLHLCIVSIWFKGITNGIVLFFYKLIPSIGFFDIGLSIFKIKISISHKMFALQCKSIKIVRQIVSLSKFHAILFLTLYVSEILDTLFSIGKNVALICWYIAVASPIYTLEWYRLSENFVLEKERKKIIRVNLR